MRFLFAFLSLCFFNINTITAQSALPLVVVHFNDTIHNIRENYFEFKFVNNYSDTLRVKAEPEVNNYFTGFPELGFTLYRLESNQRISMNSFLMAHNFGEEEKLPTKLAPGDSILIKSDYVLCSQPGIYEIQFFYMINLWNHNKNPAISEPIRFTIIEDLYQKLRNSNH